MDLITSTGRENRCSVTDFVLIGFSGSPNNQMALFVLGLLVYFFTLAGNLTIIALIQTDQCLQTPMYFLLGNLAFVEICYISTTVPKVLWDLLLGDKSISFLECLLQMYYFVTLGSTECVLLSAMAYDRYAAICQPLHYTLFMKRSICWALLAVSWVIGNANSIINTAIVFSLCFCQPNQIDHFFCDIPPLLHLSCSDTFNSQMVTFTVSGCVIIVPFISLIVLSYFLIVSAVLKIHSAQGRIKTFSTCASHLTVVSIFYSTAIFTYMRPSSSHSMDQDQLISLMYTVITPLLNPFIYSFKNKELQAACLEPGFSNSLPIILVTKQKIYLLFD
uniref:Olfactory receptor n=1 Tax=Salvator merianae TaxID=96440 RepID=A0A8D0BJ28_SALMN